MKMHVWYETPPVGTHASLHLALELHTAYRLMELNFITLIFELTYVKQISVYDHTCICMVYYTAVHYFSTPDCMNLMMDLIQSFICHILLQWSSTASNSMIDSIESFFKALIKAMIYIHTYESHIMRFVVHAQFVLYYIY